LEEAMALLLIVDQELGGNKTRVFSTPPTDDKDPPRATEKLQNISFGVSADEHKRVLVDDAGLPWQMRGLLKLRSEWQNGFWDCGRPRQAGRMTRLLDTRSRG
jgi:hypothetical protein